MALSGTSRLDKTMSEAKRLTLKYPTQPMPLNVQGTIVIPQRRDEEAVAVLRQASKMAPDYDNVLLNLGQALTLTGEHDYDGPATLRTLLDEVKDGSDFRTLDLGCGTGLTGLTFKDIARDMTGVDLSSKMLKEAAKKDIYSELVCGDVITWLQRQIEQFDLFIAADMLIYVGRLESIFDAVRSHCTESARFAITTELLDDDEGDMELRTSGRYAHSNSYVKRAAAEQDFEVEAYITAPLRKEHKEWLEGGFYILKAAAQA